MDLESRAKRSARATKIARNKRRNRLVSHLGWVFSNKAVEEKEVNNAPQTQKIESYRPGYPRFSALIAAHDSFYICRRFSNLRARLLLLKQDKLSLLEKRLEAIDQEEPAALFLGKSRLDTNEARISVLSEIDRSLADYDSFIERTSRLLGFKPAQSRDRTSLQNWVDGTGCLAREETEYLDYPKELIELGSTSDNATTKVEAWVEDNLIWFCKCFRRRKGFDVSNDPNVYIYSGTLIKRIARTILVILITILLLAPVIICDGIKNVVLRMVVIIFSNILLQMILASSVRSKTIELFIAGATYSTLLIVFLSGTNSTPG